MDKSKREDDLDAKKREGWLQEADGSLVKIPEDAETGNYLPNIKIVVGRRVYERSRLHDDGTWIFVYQMTEPV